MRALLVAAAALLATAGGAHSIPKPYHTTDELMMAIHSLAKGCNTKDVGTFKLEFVSSKEAMDLEMDTEPVAHGKSDAWFDSQQQAASQAAALAAKAQALVQEAGEKPAAKSADTPATLALKEIQKMTLERSDTPGSAPAFAPPAASLLEVESRESDIGPGVLASLQPEPIRKRALPGELSGALLQEAPANELPAGWNDKSTPPTELPVLRVSLGGSTPRDNAFIMFGEHGREFISGEIGLTFIQSLHSVLCDDTPKPAAAEQVATALAALGAPVTEASTPSSVVLKSVNLVEQAASPAAVDPAAAELKPAAEPAAAQLESVPVGGGDGPARDATADFPPFPSDPVPPEPAAAVAEPPAAAAAAADPSLADAAAPVAAAETLTAMLEIDSSMYATKQPYSREQILGLLSKWDLTIMPLVSPSAREMAEKKSFCNRKNSHGVDVNRNYPFHFGEGTNDPESDQFAGLKPLSEPETRIAARLAMEIRPKLFVAVHSGAAMVVTSPAYRPFEMKQLPVGMQKVVEGIQQNDCTNCKVGPASQVLSYLAYGCSMDYMFEEGFSQQGNPADAAEEHFAFTFETWQGDDRRQSPMADAAIRQQFSQQEAPQMIENEKAFYALHSAIPEKEFHCLLTFNPPPTKVESMQQQWTKGLYSTLDSVSKELTARRSAKSSA